jgi:hypothetical protein
MKIIESFGGHEVSRGKMNWEKTQKENRRIKQGSVICDDNGLIEAEIIPGNCGYKPGPFTTCPKCLANMDPSLLLDHLKRCGLKDAKNPFDFKIANVKRKKIRKFNNSIEEMERLVQEKYGAGRLRGLLIDLTQRENSVWKPLIGKALNKYLMLTYPVFGAKLDGLNFVIFSIEEKKERFKSNSLKEVLIWLKKEWKPLKRVEDQKITKPLRVFPRFKAFLSDYQGASSYEGLIISIASNPEGTYSLMLKSANLKYTICRSARMDIAIVIAEYYSMLNCKPSMKEQFIISEILKYNSRNVNEKEVRIIESDQGLIDINLLNDELSETICKKTLPIAALNVLEFLSSGQIFKS